MLVAISAAGLGACSSSSGAAPGTNAVDAAGAGGASAPTAASDSDASNPHVTPSPPASPNGPAKNGDAGTVVMAPSDAGVVQAPGDAGAPDAAPDAPVKSWPTVDCVGGPCAAPNVCVNLDFLFVACVPCGGVDQVCCPPYSTTDPFLGACDPGLICAANPNFQDMPPLDLVKEVCQVPGSPPPADGGFNNQRRAITVN
jgi:hypothetical protein